MMKVPVTRLLKRSMIPTSSLVLKTNLWRLFLNDESPGDKVAQEVGDAHQQLREEVGRVAGVAQLGLEVTELLDLLAQSPDHRRQTLAPFLTKKY
jgi:hypothetical protein